MSSFATSEFKISEAFGNPDAIFKISSVGGISSNLFIIFITAKVLSIRILPVSFALAIAYSAFNHSV